MTISENMKKNILAIKGLNRWNTDELANEIGLSYKGLLKILKTDEPQKVQKKTYEKFAQFIMKHSTITNVA
jgi:DNA-binding Xre family transcriptional regulator